MQILERRGNACNANVVGVEEAFVAADQKAALAGFGILQQAEREVVCALLFRAVLKRAQSRVRLVAADTGQCGEAGNDDDDQGAEYLKAGVESEKHALGK
jgi:hypothetical protein